MKQLTGNEQFTFHGSDAGISVLDFWSWSSSDLLNNTQRGVLAEFLVHSAFGNSQPQHDIRTDWMPFDLTSPSGRRIEVKSSAYLQSWEQDYYSHILFDIAPHRAWSPETGYSPDAKRNSDLYVFCLYTSLSREQSITDLSLWEFYVLATSTLNEKTPLQKTIGLPSLMKLEPIKTDYAGLCDAIETITL
jgi:hypothetical protein